MDKANWSKAVRVVWAIFRKDMVDAIRNKTILTSIGSVIFVVVMYRYLPGLDEQDLPVRVMLHDAGNSELAIALEDSPNLLLRTYDSREEMRAALVASDKLTLGLTLPADVEQRIGRQQPLQLEGQIAYWIDDDDAQRLVDVVQAEIAYLSGHPVRLKLDQAKVYPMDPGEAGSGFLVSLAVVFVLVMMGALIVTHLILDEKQAKTIDALMISPASPFQMVIGKALVGLVYTSLGVAAVFALNAGYIVHWGVAILGALCGALFATGLGILLGVLFDTRQQLIVWGFVLMGTIMLPVFFVIVVEGLPGAVAIVLRSLPTTATAWVIRASFVRVVPRGQTLSHLGIVMAYAVIAFGLATWRVRRLER